MKKIISVFAALCIFAAMITFTASAAAERIDLSHVYVELTAPDGFETMTPDNLAEHQKLLDYIDTTQEEMANYMTSQYIEMFSMPLDKSCELTLQVYKINDLNVFDLAQAKEKDLADIRENIENDANFTCNSLEIVDANESKFFKIERTDVAGLESISYVTVKNGANYALTLTKSNGEKLSQTDRDNIEFVFKSFSFTETLKDPSRYNWLAYILIAAIFVVAIAIIYVVIKRTKGWGDKSYSLKNRGK